MAHKEKPSCPCESCREDDPGFFCVPLWQKGYRDSDLPLKRECKDKHKTGHELCFEHQDLCPHHHLRIYGCKECDVDNYLMILMTSHHKRATGDNEEDPTEEDVLDALGVEAIEDYREYIESLWEPWMSWQNHGNAIGTWQIDHVEPIKGPWIDQAERMRRLHYHNTAPLSTTENRRKWTHRFVEKRKHDDNGTQVETTVYGTGKRNKRGDE